MAQDEIPPGVDPSQPSPARVYDYLLGGTHNFEADRAAGELMKSMAPELIDSASANRGFHQRAAKWLAEHGIRQFIDIGSGLPTVGNTHEVVARVRPDTRTVYVDYDPMVLHYGSYLLSGNENAAVILADMRDPDSVLGNETLRAMIDFSEPAAIMMTAVLHFVSDEDDPAGLIARYTEPLVAGSYLSLSHTTADHKPPKAVAAIYEAGRRSAGGTYLRSRAEVTALLNGLEIVSPYEGAPPEVTWVGLWGCEDVEAADSEGSRWLYCAVARKTA